MAKFTEEQLARFFEEVVKRMYELTSEDTFEIESRRRYLSKMCDPETRKDSVDFLLEHGTSEVRERVNNDYAGWLEDLALSNEARERKITARIELHDQLMGSQHGIIDYLAAVASGKTAHPPSDTALVDRVLGDMMNYVPTGELGVGREEMDLGIAIHTVALSAIIGHARANGISSREYAIRLRQDVPIPPQLF